MFYNSGIFLNDLSSYLKSFVTMLLKLWNTSLSLEKISVNLIEATKVWICFVLQVCWSNCEPAVCDLRLSQEVRNNIQS